MRPSNRCVSVKANKHGVSSRAPVLAITSIFQFPGGTFLPGMRKVVAISLRPPEERHSTGLPVLASRMVSCALPLNAVVRKGTVYRLSVPDSCGESASKQVMQIRRVALVRICCSLGLVLPFRLVLLGFGLLWAGMEPRRSRKKNLSLCLCILISNG